MMDAPILSTIVQFMPYLPRVVLGTLLLLVLTLTTDAQAQRGRSNVLYSDRPLPVRLGVEIGTGLTSFLNATPTMFPVRYPYSDGDTIHLRFPDGHSPLFGFYIGLSADWSISRSWSILGKVHYNERRGNWESTMPMPYIGFEGPTTAPLTNELTLIMRYLAIEGYGKYAFASMDDLYVGAGLSIGALLSNHYDMRQTLGGPPEVSFVDFGTGQATGIKDYRVGYEFGEELRKLLLDLKLLVGYPIPIGNRWSLNPEITLAFPLTQVFSESAEKTYRSAGVNETPNPLTITGILALRREL